MIMKLEELNRRIGTDLYLISAGMIVGQVFFYLTMQLYSLLPTIIAFILILCGRILRRT